MLIEQINEFKLREPAPPPGHTCTHTTGYFYEKKSRRKIFEWIIIYC